MHCTAGITLPDFGHCVVRSRIARRQRFDNHLHEAEKYAKQNNTHKLYAIIRQLARKQPFKHVKVYGPEGEILTRREEVERLKTHFHAIFCGDDASGVHPLKQACAPPTAEEIVRALERTPLRKAVPKHFAPGAAWRAAAQCVAPIVHKAVCRVWATANVPQHWKDGWMVLICVSPTSQAVAQVTLGRSVCKTRVARPSSNLWRTKSGQRFICMPLDFHSTRTCRDVPLRVRS